MNECTSPELKDVLPDLLHDTLVSSDRVRVEAHVASCASCAEELRVLRAVKSAAVFVPQIDVNKIVAQVPPYQRIVPAQAPARSRVSSWLVATSMLVVALIGGSLFATRTATTVRTASPVVDTVPIAAPPQLAQVPVQTSAPVAETARVVAPRHTHSLAIAADVDGLSDGSLVRLMDDMDHFDGLPSSDPEPVFAVDTGDEIGQH